MLDEEFQNWLHHRLNQPLPGLDAQLEMAPSSRKNRIKDLKIPKDARKSAVLILLYPDKNRNILLPMQERTEYKGVHSRQIGLPGGSVEYVDDNFEDTALRETEEELGIERKEVELLGRLTKIYIPPSNYLVQPVVGIAKSRPNFVIDPTEVQSLLEASIQFFTDLDAIQTGTIKGRNNETLEVPCFRVHDHIVWGATAMIMNEFREILNEVFS